MRAGSCKEVDLTVVAKAGGLRLPRAIGTVVAVVEQAADRTAGAINGFGTEVASKAVGGATTVALSTYSASVGRTTT